MSLDERQQALETAQSAFTLASYLTGYLDAHGNDTLRNPSTCSLRLTVSLSDSKNNSTSLRERPKRKDEV